ncbi:PREDICTED: serine-threonine kinase receptor-associated protein [Ceratosolen solmsi marchali]|uniref:Serine-threonine kinase receptor-associated protein n=1 Tax=Ceratosolen solmsi marchali TaxID=326594 RepID=A0AAJ7DVV0_9HYME|nr:PREDICTED: serine-threonine kinase receptor-associated protein [Ceratosolen solmsi marchali]
MANLKQTPLTCSGHQRPVVHLEFSDITDSSYYLISACKDGQPMLRQGDTGDWIGTFKGHKGAVWGVALNVDATKAASGAADFNAKVWDAIKGEEIHSFQHEHIVKSVDFSKDSVYLATASKEKIVRVFDLNKPEAEPQIFSGHTSGLRHVSFYENDTLLVSCAEDKTMRVWDRHNGKEIRNLDFQSVPRSMEVSKDGSIITTTHSNIVTFWDSKELTKLREFTVPTQVNSASLHPDNSVFICGGEDLKMYKFDCSTGVEIESLKGHFGPIHCVCFSPDGELYASCSEDGTLRLWQTTVGKTYGLWRFVEQPPTIQENSTTVNSKQEVTAN